MPSNDGNSSDIFLSNKQYNFIKWLTVVFFPALGTLYFALATIWGFPAGEQVLGSLMATEAFLGALIGISTKQYEKSEAKYDGTINVDDTPDKTLFSLELNEDPQGLSDKDQVIFKVNPK